MPAPLSTPVIVRKALMSGLWWGWVAYSQAATLRLLFYDDASPGLDVAFSGFCAFVILGTYRFKVLQIDREHPSVQPPAQHAEGGPENPGPP